MPVVTAHSDGTAVVAYCLLDSEGRTLAARDPGAVFYAASTVKLGVMIAAVREAEAGRLSLEERLACSRRFASAVPGAPAFAVGTDDTDARFPRDGETAALGELIAMMICRSSNEATNLLLLRLGFESVAEAFATCGAVNTRMERMIGDDGAIAAGLTNETTPGDLARLIRAAVVPGLAAGPDGASWMRNLLAAQEHRRIAGIVPEGTAWGSKSGDVPGIEHDVAFVGDPASPEVRFVAVCTRGFEEDQGRESIQAVASALLA